MEAFLRANKDRLESARGRNSLNIHVVLGNEACDLDSAVSSLVWAYYLDKQQDVTQTCRDVVLPVFNIPHEDYHLRTEVTHFLSLVNGIGASTLVFRDDLDLSSQHAAGNLTLTLVDHNTLGKPDQALDDAVVEVIDHHANGRQDDAERDIRVTVETVGSCSSLIAERILAEAPDTVDEHIAKLLLGPILVDTVKLSRSAGKATAKDIAMVEALSKICPDLNQDEMYRELQHAKADMSDFSVTDILKKDFKCVFGTAMNIGMSSVPMDLKELMEKPDFSEELQNFCTSKNLRLEVIMGMGVDDNGVAHRQIVIYSPTSSDSLKDDLIQTLETSSNPEFLLSKIDTDIAGLVAYYQDNMKASRKQVMPVVRDFLNMQEEAMEDEETEEPIATQSDLTDMNTTLLKLSSNTNNANKDILSSDLFGMSDNQVVSSPESSGIDAGSVLLDLDPFALNQNGMVTSGSGTFSSRDSVDTLGITPSSPSSDAVGFGAGTEDLLGLDPFGSSQQTLDPVDPSKTPSNPFASSMSSDSTLLDAFMSPPDPVLDKPEDSSSTMIAEDALTPEPEATVSVSLDDLSLPAGGSGTSDLLGLDPFNPTPISEDASAATDLSMDPFSVSDTTITATVSTNIESSPGGLDDFMSQLPDQQTALEQPSFDSASGLVDVMSDDAVDPFSMPNPTNSNPFLSETFGSQSNDSTDQPSDLIGSSLLEDEPQASSITSLQEESQQILDQERHTSEGEPQDVLMPTPDVTIAQLSDQEEETGDRECGENDEHSQEEVGDGPTHGDTEESVWMDVSQETESSKEIEAFPEEDTSDVIQNDEEVSPSPIIGSEDRTNGNFTESVETAALHETEDISGGTANPPDTILDSDWSHAPDDSTSSEIAPEPVGKEEELSEGIEDQPSVSDQEEDAVCEEVSSNATEDETEGEDFITSESELTSQAENPVSSEDVLEIPGSSDHQEALSEDGDSGAVNVDDADVEVPLMEIESKEDVALPASDGLESTSGSVEEFSGPGSISLPTSFTLEVPVAGAPDSLGANFLSMSDEAGARSSGITSPDSDFTSDIISDDPSSGDSYIVTDLSHEVGNYHIEDIQEEVEEEVEEEKDLEEDPQGPSEVHIDVIGSQGDDVGTFQDQINGNLDNATSEDLQGGPQTEVIDDYFTAESKNDEVQTDVIPIPTDVGFQSSGRSSPKDLSENEDDALLKKEAHGLVADVIKMATITFLESEDDKGVSSQAHHEETSEEVSEEMIRESEDDVAIKDPSILPVESHESTSHEADDTLKGEEEDLLASEANKSKEQEPTIDEFVAQEEAPEEESQNESLVDVLTDPRRMAVEEEVAAVVVSQEECAMKSDEVLPQEDEQIRDEVVEVQADRPVVEDIVVTVEHQTEQEVPLSEEAKESTQTPIEVDVVINEQGPEDVEEPEQSSSGKTRLSVGDSLNDVDIEVETNTRKTSVFGLADILEYVNAEGEVQVRSTDPHTRPSTLSLNSKSTPKSSRLLSAGTPISMLSDTGTPMTPISLRSLDITSDTGTDEDILDQTGGEEQTSKTSSPLAAKRCISIDSNVVEDIHGEWDEKQKILDSIVEKERKKSAVDRPAKPSPQREMSFGTAEAKQRMEGVVLPDEWQDDEFSQQKLAGVDSVQDEDSFFKRRVPPKDNKDRNRDSVLSDDGSVEGLSAWAEKLAGDDGFDEEDELEEASVPDDTLNSASVEPIPEYSAKEEMEDRKNWRKVVIGSKEFTLDMRSINPYKKVLSHGGYYGDGVNAIIVLASCYMPDRSRKDYNYIMNNLFIYVISTLELLVVQDYVIVYFHGAAPKNRIPSLTWMRKCYQMIDRKLRKNLKGLYIVHPTTWLRTIIRFTRPFISSKFSRKLKFVDCLDDLPSLVNMEYIYVPDEVRRFDDGKKQKEGDGVALWGWISSKKERDTSSDGGSSCYTKGPDSDIVPLDDDYLDEMLLYPTSRAARRRMSAQLRRGNFALSSLQQERARDFEDSDSLGYMEDDMFADFENDGEEDEEEDEKEETIVGMVDETLTNEEEDKAAHPRRSLGEQELEYEEEIDPFSHPLSAAYQPHHHQRQHPTRQLYHKDPNRH